MIRALSLVLLLAYPFVVYLGLDRLGLKILAPLLGVLLLARLFASGITLKRFPAIALGLLVIGFVFLAWQAPDDRVLRSYPVFINLGLFALFALSLRFPPTAPERGMRLAGQHVPEEAKNYLRWVTVAWCGFFLLNGSIAAWTAWQAPVEIWTLYNGALSYVFIGLFFLGEYAIRTVVKRRHAAAGEAHE